MRKSTFILSLSLIVAGTGTAAAQDAAAVLDRTGWTITASSWQREGTAPGGEASCIIDGNDATYWHSYYAGAANTDPGAGTGIPQWFTIDLGASKTFDSFGYLPRPYSGTSLPNGVCTGYKLFVSDTPFTATTRDEVNALTGPAMEGTLSYDGDTAPTLKTATNSTDMTGRYVMFVITSGQAGFGSCAEFYLADGGMPTAVNVTYNFKINGKSYGTPVTKSEFSGSAPSVTAPDFTTISGYSVTSITASTTSVDVTCAENLPFAVSTSYTESPKWQAINIHSNQGNYLWKYNADGSSVSTEITPASIAEGITDDKLWCITGDLVDGFKFYNKAAGADLTLWKEADGSTATMSNASSRNNFKLYKTASASIASGFCFKLDGDNNYLNRQDNLLKGWDKKDEGSTCLAFTPASFVVNYANDALSGSTSAPAGALGVNTYLNDQTKVTELTNKKNEVSAAPYDLAKVAELATLNKAVEGGATSTEITDGGYYRIVNAAYNNVLTANANGLFCTTTSFDAAKSVASTIFRITKNGESYQLSANGKFTGAINTSLTVQFAEGETGTDLTITNNQGTPKFALQQTGGNTQQYLHCANHSGANNVVGWETAAPATWWYIVPASDIEVAMNTVNGATYATAYLPFAVSMPQGVKAYTGTVDGTNLNLNEVSGNVPAGTGVILVGNTTTATLPIATDAAAATAATTNDLTGTYTDKTIEATSTDYYVLATKGGELGFWLPKEGTTTLKANKAYLPASALNAAATQAQGLKLNLGGVTGIGSINAETDTKDAAIYDLTGRRVNKAAKGIYIVGGKKVLVK